MKPDCIPAFAGIRIDQAIDAPLRNAHQIGDGDRRVIQRQRQRSAVEISAGNHLALLRKDERVVGCGSGFYREHFFTMRHSSANGAVDLRHATKAVGILHPRIVLEMRHANFAVA
jgi:alpha-tubulin suppressor-like RCC1 family protein